MKKPFMMLTVIVSLSVGTAASSATPFIQSIKPASVKAGGVVSISGHGFSSPDKGSEIIAVYGRGFSYALNAESWSDQMIRVKVPDLGRNLTITLQVSNAAGKSNRESMRLIANMITEHSPSYAHQLKVGEKGEDQVRITNRIPGCGQTGELFVGAELKSSKRRFADAQMVAVPEPLCLQCKPLTVRWYNEPTGFIQYHIEIKKRRIEGICPNQTRRAS